MAQDPPWYFCNTSQSLVGVSPVGAPSPLPLSSSPRFPSPNFTASHGWAGAAVRLCVKLSMPLSGSVYPFRGT